jgi:hypothetical protein
VNRGAGLAVLAVLAVLPVLPVLAGCRSQRKSALGFHLPDGDPERGKAAFVALQCFTCHEVAGVELPPPTALPRVPVVLGGRVTIEPTDGELVTSIVHPSHALSRRSGDVASGSLSRMGDYNHAMTVQQLIDLVAFLHSVQVVDHNRTAATGF